MTLSFFVKMRARKKFDVSGGRRKSVIFWAKIEVEKFRREKFEF